MEGRGRERVGEKACVKEGAIGRGNSGAREERMRERKRKPEGERASKKEKTCEYLNLWRLYAPYLLPWIPLF